MWQRRPIRAVLAGSLLAALAWVARLDAQGAPEPRGLALARAAAEQVGVTTIYDPSYARLAFPMGDVARERGACSDVIVRAFRAIGVDLQREVNRDMSANFAEYPSLWGLVRPDRNIDHRRVPNLMRYFERQGKRLGDAASFEAGDVVAWRLPGNLFHIGIAAAERVPATSRPFMIHNIGQGARKEDVLRAYPILGHYRW